MKQPTGHKQIKVLRYPCNLVGFARLAMLGAAVAGVAVYHSAGWQASWRLRLALALWLAVSGLLLDVADGYLARRLGHETKFGALFELTLDLLGHTLVWTLSGLAVAPLLIALEWSVGLHIAAFIVRPDDHWKRVLANQGPWLVRVYWKPMRINWLNGYSNVSHFVFPISLFVFGGPTWLSYLALPGLVAFELVSAAMLLTLMKILVAEATPPPQ